MTQKTRHPIIQRTSPFLCSSLISEKHTTSYMTTSQYLNTIEGPEQEHFKFLRTAQVSRHFCCFQIHIVASIVMGSVSKIVWAVVVTSYNCFLQRVLGIIINSNNCVLKRVLIVIIHLYNCTLKRLLTVVANSHQCISFYHNNI